MPPTPTFTRPKLLATKDYSAHSGLPKYKLRALVHQGLPCLRSGSKLYFDPEKADAWIAQHLASDTGTELDEHVRELVDQFPPLTAAQVDKIAMMLRGGAA